MSRICSSRKDGTILEHLHHCSVCNPTKIFLTSKFSYLLFSPTQSTAGAMVCSAFYQPQHPLGKCWAKSFCEAKPKHHVLIFLHPIFPCRAGGAALTLFPSQKRMTPYGCSYLITI
jgi:hypothetical protein